MHVGFFLTLAQCLGKLKGDSIFHRSLFVLNGRPGAYVWMKSDQWGYVGKGCLLGCLGWLSEDEQVYIWVENEPLVVVWWLFTVALHQLQYTVQEWRFENRCCTYRWEDQEDQLCLNLCFIGSWMNGCYMGIPVTVQFCMKVHSVKLKRRFLWLIGEKLQSRKERGGLILHFSQVFLESLVNCQTIFLSLSLHVF